MRQRELILDSPLIADDLPRLGEQQAAIAKLMASGVWYTLADLRACLQYRGIAASEAGISARIRDLRKPPIGWTVERKRIANGVFAYRVNSHERKV